MTLKKSRSKLFILVIACYLAALPHPTFASDSPYVLTCSFFENESVRIIPANPARKNLCIGSISFTLNLNRAEDKPFSVKEVTESTITKLWCPDQITNTLFHDKQNMVVRIGKKTQTQRQILITHRHLADEAYHVLIDRKSRTVKRLSNRLLNEYKAVMHFGKSSSITLQTKLRSIPGKCFLNRAT